ncbi:MAG TPA: helix-turn-helix domain-containing protein [Bdellovibrionota bacterium]|nr:helix-turn-helix domain-containing protein [Bdellovibrionota bacterium]
MKNRRGQSFEELLARQLRKKEVRFLFDERRFYLQVAHLISELRAKVGLSQLELAKRARVTQPLIARLERGDRQRTPTFDMVFRILKALGYSLELSARADPRLAA